jgi:DNA topoisomerase-1
VTLDEAVALLAEKGKMLKPRGAAARKARGRVGAKTVSAEGAPAPAKTRAAPRKKAARPAAQAKPAAPKRATAKKKAGTKQAKGAARR